jgi:hypothetical protein
MSAGRPSEFSQDIADQVCGLIAEGKSLRKICEREDMPDKSTVFRWLAKNKEFRDQYALAREAQMDAMAEDILDISDDGTNDFGFKEGEEASGAGANPVFLAEHVQRSKLRVESRKWLMGKLAPKKYGDRTETDLNVKGSVTITATILDEKL